MAAIKNASVFDGENWGAPVPFGADDINISITSATEKDPDNSSGVNLDSTDVAVSSGDTAASAWTKFNRFRKRVINKFTDIIVTAYTTTGVNNKTYSTKVINDFMTNVIGYTGTSTPSAGKISSQLSKISFGVSATEAWIGRWGTSWSISTDWAAIGNKRTPSTNNTANFQEYNDTGTSANKCPLLIKNTGLYAFEWNLGVRSTAATNLWTRIASSTEGKNPSTVEVIVSPQAIYIPAYAPAGSPSSVFPTGRSGVFRTSVANTYIGPMLSKSSGSGTLTDYNGNDLVQIYLIRRF